MKETVIDIISIIAGLTILLTMKSSGVAGMDEANFMVFGTGLFLAFLSGKLLSRYGMPSITSFLLIGMLLGPYVTNIFTSSMIQELSLIDDVALSIIAMTAGGEISFRNSRINIGKAGVFVIAQIIIVFAITYIVLTFTRDLFPGGLFASTAAIVFMCVIVNAKSPSTTVAVIIESEAKGKLTDYTLTSAIIKDILIIIIFTFVLSIYGNKGEVSVTHVVIEEGLSMLSGLVLSLIFIGYIKYVKSNQGVFIMIFTITMTWVAQSLHLNPLLVFLFAGIGVNNFSRYGHSVVQSIENNSGIIYLIFFFIAGTAVNIPALKVMWAAALGIVVLRTVSMFIGCYVSALIIKEDDNIKKYSYLGFLGQAGVSIGFAKVIGSTFEGWGMQFQTLILAVVAINQIIGPIGFKWALKKAGETPSNNGHTPKGFKKAA
jgi:Kef-type K+ transport system membrane component KefB